MTGGPAPAAFLRPVSDPGAGVVAGPHLLDTYHQTSTARSGADFATGLLDCPHNDFLLVDPATGRTTRGRCRRLRCHACISWCAYRAARAIGLAAPDQAVLLTRVGRTWQGVRRGINRFTEFLRKDGAAIEIAYHVEQDPSLENQHVHAWVHGAPLDDETVRATAARVGFGEFAGVMKWEAFGETGPVVKYGLKTVLNRPVDATSLWPEAEQFLVSNGNRLVHQTNGFYRAGVDGEQLGTDAAISRALHGTNEPPRYKVVGTAQGDAHNLHAPV